MKYYETDFCREEQPVIDELRKRGYFVYGLRDGYGGHYTVEPRVYVDNIGFIVTDEPIEFHENNFVKYITDAELMKIGEVDHDTIPRVIDDIGLYLCPHLHN